MLYSHWTDKKLFSDIQRWKFFLSFYVLFRLAMSQLKRCFFLGHIVLAGPFEIAFFFPTKTQIKSFTKRSLCLLKNFQGIPRKNCSRISCMPMSLIKRGKKYKEFLKIRGCHIHIKLKNIFGWNIRIKNKDTSREIGKINYCVSNFILKNQSDKIFFDTFISEECFVLFFSLSALLIWRIKNEFFFFQFSGKEFFEAKLLTYINKMETLAFEHWSPVNEISKPPDSRNRRTTHFV